ncbi:unknown [Lactobacillus phage Lb338-1]|uniref:Uncharacterized protein n=1 Tax=Lactobacillus phage Lb338-1 TaxID=2892342 RepID=C1KFL2_9CAUD|nr:hypothetical protein lb338_phage_102 [Lactobacillus phage Lb338-1]ACO37023.1 unknown [Lactobacillus phage Lb338-1]
MKVKVAKTASEFLRVSDKEKKQLVEESAEKIVDIVKDLWENHDFSVNDAMKDKVVDSVNPDDPMGTVFSANLTNDKVESVYEILSQALISKDDVSKRVGELIGKGNAFDLGDAKVNKSFVQAYIEKANSNPAEPAVLSIRFSLLLPEYGDKDEK